MRTFYLFRIRDAYYQIEKRTPKHLFCILNEVLTKNECNSFEMSLMQNIIMPTDKDEVEERIKKIYKNNDSYMTFKHAHKYANYTTKEKTELVVKNACIVLKSTVTNPTFLSSIILNKHYLACDFINKDYFWLESVA